jgi:hypothetical protein
LPEILTACAIFFLLAHGVDALITRYVARMGLHPAVREKPTLGASLVQFATVTGIFLLAVVGAVVTQTATEMDEYYEAERQERAQLEATPAAQQARAFQEARVEQITVAELAERISGQTSDWTVVLLYQIRNEHSQWFFPQLVALHRKYENSGVAFQLYSADNDEQVPDVPPFLARHQAGFAPARLRPWERGQLSAAMTGRAAGATGLCLLC